MKKLVTGILCLTILTGCYTAKTAVWMEEGASLASYRAIEVEPVTNDTGEIFDFDVAAMLTDKLKSRLKDRGYEIVEGTSAKEKVLVVRTSLCVYDPGSSLMRWTGVLLSCAPTYFPHGNRFDMGEAVCMARSLLFDRTTGNALGRIVASKRYSGGAMSMENADKYILGIVADGIADNIDETVNSDRWKTWPTE